MEISKYCMGPSLGDGVRHLWQLRQEVKFYSALCEKPSLLFW